MGPSAVKARSSGDPSPRSQNERVVGFQPARRAMVVRETRRAEVADSPCRSAEYRAEVVAAFLASGRTIAEVAHEYGLAEPTVRDWIHEAADEVARQELAGAEADAGFQGWAEPDICSAEYRAQVVAWYLSSGKTIADVASALNLSESIVREWVWNASPDDFSGHGPLPGWAAEGLNDHDGSGFVAEVVEDEFENDDSAPELTSMDAEATPQASITAADAGVAEAVARSESKAARAAKALARAKGKAAEAVARAEAAAEAEAMARAETTAARTETAAAYAAAVEAMLRAEVTAAGTVARAEAAAAEAVAKAQAVAAEAETAAAEALARSESALVEAEEARAELAARVAAEALAVREEIAAVYAEAAEAMMRAEVSADEKVARAEAAAAEAVAQAEARAAAAEASARGQAVQADAVPAPGTPTPAAVTPVGAVASLTPPTLDRSDAEARARAKIAEMVSRMAPVELWVHAMGRTLAEARQEALDQLGVDEDQAEIEVLAQGSRWIPGRVQIRARVRVAGSAP